MLVCIVGSGQTIPSVLYTEASTGRFNDEKWRLHVSICNNHEMTCLRDLRSTHILKTVHTETPQPTPQSPDNGSHPLSPTTNNTVVLILDRLIGICIHVCVPFCHLGVRNISGPTPVKRLTLAKVKE